MDYKKLIIRGISYSQTQSGAYALLLEDSETSLKLPIIIGSTEAQSISLGIEKDLQSPRPLTHDLFSKFIISTHFRIVSVIIYQIVDGVFFSNINFIHRESGEELILDARTSDAVAMAVRFNAPMYTTPEVLDEAGVLLEINLEENSKDTFNDFDDTPELGGLENLSLEELNVLLDGAVKEEDFDTALEIQEELKKRKKKID